MTNVISVLKYSKALRDAYNALPELIKLENNIIIQQHNTHPHAFDMDYDVVFVNNAKFMIYATDDHRYYIRICNSNPFYSYCQNGICLETECQLGIYKDDFDSALNMILNWIKSDRIEIIESEPVPYMKCSLF